MVTVLAIDLGNDSGRAMLGRFDGERLTIEEVHRFPNEPVGLPDGLHWDALRLFHELKRGVEIGSRQASGRPTNLAVDTWSVE